MATQFQLLGPEDAETFVQHLITWHRSDGVWLDPVYARREAHRILTDNQGWHAWLVREQDRTVGYLMLNFRRGGAFDLPRASVAALFIVPEARGRQLGRQAHRFLMDLGRWLNVRLFECDATAENRHATLFALPALMAPRRPDPFTRQAIA
jgi:GNAT superfamily N-acetyltransferase